MDFRSTTKKGASILLEPLIVGDGKPRRSMRERKNSTATWQGNAPIELDAAGSFKATRKIYAAQTGGPSEAFADKIYNLAKHDDVLENCMAIGMLRATINHFFGDNKKNRVNEIKTGLESIQKVIEERRNKPRKGNQPNTNDLLSEFSAILLSFAEDHSEGDSHNRTTLKKLCNEYKAIRRTYRLRSRHDNMQTLIQAWGRPRVEAIIPLGAAKESTTNLTGWAVEKPELAKSDKLKMVDYKTVVKSINLSMLGRVFTKNKSNSLCWRAIDISDALEKYKAGNVGERPYCNIALEKKRLVECGENGLLFARSELKRIGCSPENIEKLLLFNAKTDNYGENSESDNEESGGESGDESHDEESGDEGGNESGDEYWDEGGDEISEEESEDKSSKPVPSSKRSFDALWEGVDTPSRKKFRKRETTVQPDKNDEGNVQSLTALLAQLCFEDGYVSKDLSTYKCAELPNVFHWLFSDQRAREAVKEDLKEALEDQNSKGFAFPSNDKYGFWYLGLNHSLIQQIIARDPFLYATAVAASTEFTLMDPQIEWFALPGVVGLHKAGIRAAYGLLDFQQEASQIGNRLRYDETDSPFIRSYNKPDSIARFFVKIERYGEGERELCLLRTVLQMRSMSKDHPGMATLVVVDFVGEKNSTLKIGDKNSKITTRKEGADLHRSLKNTGPCLEISMLGSIEGRWDPYRDQSYRLIKLEGISRALVGMDYWGSTEVQKEAKTLLWVMKNAETKLSKNSDRTFWWNWRYRKGYDRDDRCLPMHKNRLFFPLPAFRDGLAIF
ncbi:hypothetical protein AA313_de0205506 [Arthrobotrys entomopaga]|nr:hypothetical protein AA313_de0205506 [Arthrobotrys entomopaga]